MRILSIASLIISLLITSCQPRPTVTETPVNGTPAETQVAVQTDQPTPSETPLPSSTPTIEPERAIMVIPDNPEGLYAGLFEIWQAETANQGYALAWTRQAGLAAGDLGSSVRLVVVAPEVLTTEALLNLASGAPQTHFVAYEQPGLSAGANIWVIDPLRYDRLGFIAGYMAAMITGDWRVGVLSPTDTPAGQAASTGFLNGAVFFCGLCNPFYGPVVDYPVAAGQPSTASSAEWVAAAQALLDQAVTTVFLGPGVDDPMVLALLVEKDVIIIGSSTMPEEAAGVWAFSVQPEDSLAGDLVSAIRSGTGGQQVAFVLGISQINPELLTPGRQAFAAITIRDVNAGLIDPGVESGP